MKTTNQKLIDEIIETTKRLPKAADGLAGAYAFQTAFDTADNRCDVSDASIAAHLETLSNAGAVFDRVAAQVIAIRLLTNGATINEPMLLESGEYIGSYISLGHLPDFTCQIWHVTREGKIISLWMEGSFIEVAQEWQRIQD